MGITKISRLPVYPFNDLPYLLVLVTETVHMGADPFVFMIEQFLVHESLLHQFLAIVKGALDLHGGNVLTQRGELLPLQECYRTNRTSAASKPQGCSGTVMQETDIIGGTNPNR